MNGSDWGKLERMTRQLHKHYDEVRIISGPVFAPRMKEGRQVIEYEVIGENQVAVPTHLFKVIYLEKPKTSDAIHATFSKGIVSGGMNISIQPSALSHHHHLHQQQQQMHASGFANEMTPLKSVSTRLLTPLNSSISSNSNTSSNNNTSSNSNTSNNSNTINKPASNSLISYRPPNTPRNVFIAAFMIPNNAAGMGNPLWSYMVPLETLEKHTGLSLTPRIQRPNESVLMGTCQDLWKK